MTKFALFDHEGFPTAFYSEDVHGPRLLDGESNPECIIPAEAIEISDDQWLEFLSNYGRRRWENGAVVEHEMPEPPSAPIVLYRADLWRRTTENEAEQIEEAMNSQSARLRNLFSAAQTYQSDDPLWPVLQQTATQLFGEDRAAELLAASST